MSTPPPPLPAIAPRRPVTPGPALTVLGIGVAATALFGLDLSSEGRFDFTGYGFEHSSARAINGRAADDLFHGFIFWWTWGQLTFGAVLLVLATVLLAGLASRVLGFVLAAFTVAFGVVEVVVLAHSPTYRAFQTLRHDDRILDHATYGTWIGLAGLVLLVASAVITALSANRTVAAAYRPHLATYPPNPPCPPVSEPPAQQL